MKFMDTLGFTPDDKTLMIVDALNLSFRYKHQDPAKEFAVDFLNTIKSLAKSYKCGKVIVAADKGSSKYRKEIYPEYKGNRTAKYAEQTEQERDAFMAFIENYEKALELVANHFTVIRHQGIEADDIAGYVCTNLKDFNKIWLISTDRDWDLLVNEKVSRFSYVLKNEKREITLDTWPYKVDRENFLLYKCLMGDSGDNIKGVEGIGEIRASTLANEYKTLDNLLETLPTIKSKAKYMANLKDAKEILLLNNILMDLTCDNIRDEEIKKELNEIMENLWK